MIWHVLYCPMVQVPLTVQLKYCLTKSNHIGKTKLSAAVALLCRLTLIQYTLSSKENSDRPNVRHPN